MGAAGSIDAPNPPLPPLPELAEGETELRLSVYKIKKLALASAGGFHSGLVIRQATGEREESREFAFNRHGVYENPSIENDPDPDYGFYQRIPLGRLRGPGARPHEVEERLLAIIRDWQGRRYDMTARNCNHFTCDVCWRLLQRPIPAWVNRLSESIEGRDRRGQTVVAGIVALEQWLDQKIREAMELRTAGAGAGAADEDAAAEERAAASEEGAAAAEDGAAAEAEGRARIQLRHRCVAALSARFRESFEQHLGPATGAAGGGAARCHGDETAAAATATAAATAEATAAAATAVASSPATSAADGHTAGERTAGERPADGRAEALEAAYAAAAQSGSFDEVAHSALCGFNREALARDEEIALWEAATRAATRSAKEAAIEAARSTLQSPGEGAEGAIAAIEERDVLPIAARAAALMELSLCGTT